MTGAFTVGAMPAGVAAPATDAQRELYRQALDLEGVFTQHLVDAMMKSAGGEEEGGAGVAQYRQMANNVLNDALIAGGGLGLAGSLYGQLAQRAAATGPATEPATEPAT